MGLVLLTGASGCNRLGQSKSAAAAASPADGMQPDASELDAGRPETDIRPPDGGSQGSASDKASVSELEAEYTPRRLTIDEEDCDEVTREALDHLRTQGKLLAARQKELEEREEAMRAQMAAQAQVEERIRELQRLSAELDDKIARARQPAGEDPTALQAERAERARSIVRVVGGMTPQKVATLLGEFKDDELAVKVLEGLPEEVAGKVLSQMRPASAARLAERLGGSIQKGARP
ncbi:MAG: hypothetical protein RMK29_13975 [Myxococcales bacterium]|nr:hypothetical protein [Myxococcota bacterium]MDW8282818.1 hypothetical protein [Myxococcales bacterium]